MSLPSSLRLALDDPRARSPLAASDALHTRVRSFARQAALDPAGTDETYEALARDIVEFQRSELKGLQRLWGDLRELDELPALPADAFRYARVAVHPEELDVARFRTSGTTQAESGIHPQRTLETYDELALLLGRASLFRGIERAVVVALTDTPAEVPTSSLTHMMQLFIEHFDGRSRAQDPIRRTARELGPQSFLMTSLGPNLPELRRAARVAELRGEPLVVLGAAFAFAALLDALGGDSIRGPSQVRLMVTGGFKGRRVEVSGDELQAALRRAFPASVVLCLGEYGMTELTSQLYEAWPDDALPASAREPALLPLFAQGGKRGRFLAPPWLRVEAIDPATGRRVPRGQVGVARFLDLGNIDSVLVVQTDDLIVEDELGVELRGRRSRAVARGCSLPYEGLLRGSTTGR